MTVCPMKNPDQPKTPPYITRQENSLYFSRAYERPHQGGYAMPGGDASSRLGAVLSRRPDRAQPPGEVEIRR